MPISKYFSGHGEQVMANMRGKYGSKKAKEVFYATENKRKKKSGMAGRLMDLHMAGKLRKK